MRAAELKARGFGVSAPNVGELLADLDKGSYPKGIKVSNQEMAQINLVADSFHGEWNYSICSKVFSK
jgi:hypothetical protein